MAFLGSLGKALGKLAKGVGKAVKQVAKTAVKIAPVLAPMVLPGPWGEIAGAVLGGGRGKSKLPVLYSGMGFVPPTGGIIDPMQQLALQQMAEQMGYMTAMRGWTYGYGKGMLERVPSYLGQMTQYRLAMLGTILPYYTAMLGLPTPQQLRQMGVQTPPTPTTVATDELLNQIFGRA